MKKLLFLLLLIPCIAHAQRPESFMYKTPREAFAFDNLVLKQFPLFTLLDTSYKRELTAYLHTHRFVSNSDTIIVTYDIRKDNLDDTKLFLIKIYIYAPVAVLLKFYNSYAGKQTITEKYFEDHQSAYTDSHIILWHSKYDPWHLTVQ